VKTKKLEKRKRKRRSALYRAFVHVVVLHTHELFGEDVEAGSLAVLRDEFECALDHTIEKPKNDEPQLDSWLIEQLGHQVRHALRNPWSIGDEGSRRDALVLAIATDLAPFIDGDRRLAKDVDVLLGVLLEDAEFARLQKRLA